MDRAVLPAFRGLGGGGGGVEAGAGAEGGDMERYKRFAVQLGLILCALFVVIKYGQKWVRKSSGVKKVKKKKKKSTKAED